MIAACLQGKKSGKNEKNGLGEGVITIVHYNKDLKTSTDHIFNTMTYFIKENKILRKDTSGNYARSENATKEKNKNIHVEHSLSAKLVRPVYLIDWSKKKTYTFYENEGKKMISEDSLIDCVSEILYRAIYSPNRVSFSGVYYLEKQDEVIFGSACYAAFYINKDVADTVKFWYTTQALPVRSPINNFVPGFTHNILKLEINVYQQNELLGRIGFKVSDVKNNTLNDSLFQIPASIPIKKNVPLTEMYPPTPH